MGYQSQETEMPFAADTVPTLVTVDVISSPAANGTGLPVRTPVVEPSVMETVATADPFFKMERVKSAPDGAEFARA
jgi:hypothetical protein